VRRALCAQEGGSSLLTSVHKVEKGVSPVIVTFLLIIIAIAAITITYAFVVLAEPSVQPSDYKVPITLWIGQEFQLKPLQGFDQDTIYFYNGYTNGTVVFSEPTELGASKILYAPYTPGMNLTLNKHNIYNLTLNPDLTITFVGGMPFG
jgi:hypothetical protein